MKTLRKTNMALLASIVGIGHPGAASAEALPPQAPAEPGIDQRLKDEIEAIYASRVTAPDPASAPAPALTPQAVAKQWGFYAQLAGTDWQEGGALVSYRWKDYGRDFVVVTRGKNSVTVERIVPDRSGKKLIDMASSSSGLVEAALITASKDRMVADIVIRGTPAIDIWTMTGNAQHEAQFSAANSKQSLGTVDRVLIDRAAADALVVASPTPRLLALALSNDYDATLIINALSAPAAAIAVDPRDVARNWGVLAQLQETYWQQGSDEASYYHWREYGRVFEVMSNGLFGATIKRITADPSGALRVSITDVDPGTVAQGSVSFLKSGFAMDVVDQGTPVRTTVTLNGALLTSTTYTGPKFGTPEKGMVARATTLDAVAASMKTITTTYPRRKPGTFDPALGVLGLMAGGDWVQKSSIYDGKISPSGDRPLLLVKTASAPPQLIYVPDYSDISLISESSENTARLFARTGSGAYQADVLATSSSNPEGHATVALSVQRDGSSWVYQAVQAVDRWYLSADGRKAMDIYSAVQDGAWKEQYRKIYELRPARAAPVTLVDRLSGRIFRSGSGYFSIKWAGAGGGTFYPYVDSTGAPRSDGTVWCTKIKDSIHINCVEYRGGATKPISMQSTATNFSLGAYTFTPRADGGLDRTGTDGKVMVMPAVSPAQFAFEAGDRRDVRRINDNYRSQARIAENERQRKADEAKLWAGVVGTLARGLSSTGNAYTTARTDWGVASRVGQVATAGGRGNGSVGDMGGVTYVPAPVATPEQRRLQDELMRADARRELYASDGGAAVRRERAQADRALADHQAAYDQRHAEADASIAKIDADRAHDQQLAEVADGHKRDADAQADKDRVAKLAADRARQAKQVADTERARATAIEEGVIVMANSNTGGCFQVSNVHDLEARAGQQVREQGGDGWRREYKANRPGYGAVFAVKPDGQSAHFFIRDGFPTQAEAIKAAQEMANNFAGGNHADSAICGTWHTKGAV